MHIKTMSQRNFDYKLPFTIYFSILIILFIVVGLSVSFLSLSDLANSWSAFPSYPWLDGWTRWDGGWYKNVAENGYYYDPNMQSSVCFFPLYPMLMRIVGYMLNDVMLAGIIISIACGFGVAVLFYRWCSLSLDEREAKNALMLMLVCPFSFYLYGAVYSEALFVFLALLSFYFVENDSPILAGLAGAFASATKLVGIVLLIALAMRILEKRGIIGNKFKKSSLRLRDCGVLLSGLGLTGYFGYLWFRFGDPFLYIKASAEGWNWGIAGGPHVWFKFLFFNKLMDGIGGFDMLMLFHFSITIVAILLLPMVYRIFGLSYFVYSLLILLIALISSPDFFEMGRHVLPIFPVFAAASMYLTGRKVLMRISLAGSFVCLLILVSLFSRWYLVA